MKLAPLALLLLSACRIVAGTDDLFIGGGAPGGGAPGGGDPGGGDAGGGGAAGGAACGDDQHAITVTVIGPIEVEIDSTDERLPVGNYVRCLNDGDERLRAFCSEGSDASVSWGNSKCDDDEDRCDFTLEQDETFVVDGAGACE
jgi:hypothetical protein